MKKIIDGISKFQKEVYPEHRELFEELSTGQSPEVLFITCSDSRISPTLLTQTKPGELFIIRNAGNIVPAYGPVMGGVTATIEYAVMALKVKDIIICGHSDCGAMKGVLYPEKVASLKSVAAWLNHGDAARAVVVENYPNLPEPEKLMTLTEQNVLAQLRNIQTHPSVNGALQGGRLRLHGWVYHIGSGQVTVFNRAKDKFVPLQGEHSTAEMEAMGFAGGTR
jgi:carbonic anhydrase